MLKPAGAGAKFLLNVRGDFAHLTQELNDGSPREPGFVNVS